MARRNAPWMPRPRSHPGRKALAYHEAGHAVVGYVLGLDLERVTIVPDDSTLGHCRYRDWEIHAVAEDLDAHLLLTLAGAVAEEIAVGAPSRGADERRAMRLARMRGDSEAEACERLAWARWQVRRFAEGHWPVFKALAAALRKQRELEGSQAMRTIARAFREIGVHSPRASVRNR
jgi:Peptidase family M41